MILFLNISPQLQLPPIPMATRSTWPPWVYSTSELSNGTMERWLAVHSGVQQKPQVWRWRNWKHASNTGIIVQNWWRGKPWQTWSLEIRNCYCWHMDLNYRIYYTNHYHPSSWSNLLSPFPIQPLAYLHRWSEKPRAPCMHWPKRGASVPGWYKIMFVSVQFLELMWATNICTSTSILSWLYVRMRFI